MYAYQLCRALYEIHKLGIMHWDIKPENFFMANNENAQNNTIKLGDFGEAKAVEKGKETQRHTKVGTELYMSPEMLNHKVKEGFKYSSKTDIWGLGMVLAELMCLDYPF